MKDDPDIKAIEEYLTNREFTLKVGMSSKVQVADYEPKSVYQEISIEKTLEDDLSSLHEKVSRWLKYQTERWEGAVRPQKEASVKPGVQVPMKDVITDAKDGGLCKKCGTLMTVWKEGGVSKTTGKAYSGFYACPNYNDHR